jgi:hypothetical protein
MFMLLPDEHESLASGGGQCLATIKVSKISSENMGVVKGGIWQHHKINGAEVGYLWEKTFFPLT